MSEIWETIVYYIFVAVILFIAYNYDYDGSFEMSGEQGVRINVSSKATETEAQFLRLERQILGLERKILVSRARENGLRTRFHGLRGELLRLEAECLKWYGDLVGHNLSLLSTLTKIPELEDWVGTLRFCRDHHITVEHEAVLQYLLHEPRGQTESLWLPTHTAGSHSAPRSPRCGPETDTVDTGRIADPTPSGADGNKCGT